MGVMRLSQTDTLIVNQALVMQEKLHPEGWTETYHLEGKFIFKMNPGEEVKRNIFSDS